MNFEDEDFELKEVQRLEGHTDRVWSIAWKPTAGVDGVPAVLASCSGDKTVRIWEQTSPTGSFHCKEVLEGAHTEIVTACSWSPSGKLLATASYDATAAIWKEDAGGKFVRILTLKGHDKEVKSVSWNASGKLLATCGRDKSVAVWEVIDMMEWDSLWKGHKQDVKMVQWHPSMDILFSCSSDNTIKVWTLDSEGEWYCDQTLNRSSSGHKSTVWALSLNATGDKMVSCSDDRTIKIWDSDITMPESEEENPQYYWKHLRTLSGYHNQTIFSVHWSREGIICTGAGDDAICLFVEGKSLTSHGEPTYKLLLKKEKAHDMDVNAVQWSPTQNRRLASASDDETIKIWELVSSPRKKL